MNIGKYICVSLWFVAFHVFADDVDFVRFDASANAIVINGAPVGVKHCSLAKRLTHVAPRLNWDKNVIILTDVDFVNVSDVRTCSGGSVEPSHIPRKVGFVVDVNPKRKIYLALDLVSVSPMAFTATVAKLGETRSILSAPGIFSEKMGDKKVKEEAFGYLESTPGRISPNGRYVSADGSMDCRAGAYPGVWDLDLGKNITREDGCEALFNVVAKQQ